MSSQAAMLKPVLWERLFERESAPISACRGRVRQMLVSAILSGHLPPGAPVPSSRHLADHLRIARNTVVFAYQQLVSEGYLVSRERSAISSAIRSCRGIRRTPRRAMARPPQQRRPMTRRPARWDERLRFAPRCNAISSSRATGETALPLRLWPVRPGPVSHRRMARVLYQGAVGAGHPQLGAGPHHPTTRADRADPHPGAAAPGRLGRRVRDRHHRGRAARSTCWPTCWSTTIPWSAWKTRLSRRAQYLRQPHRHLLPLPVDEHGLITGTQLLGCDYCSSRPAINAHVRHAVARTPRQPAPWPARPTA